VRHRCWDVGWFIFLGTDVNDKLDAATNSHLAAALVGRFKRCAWSPAWILLDECAVARQVLRGVSFGCLSTQAPTLGYSCRLWLAAGNSKDTLLCGRSSLASISRPLPLQGRLQCAHYCIALGWVAAFGQTEIADAEITRALCNDSLTLAARRD